MASQTLEDWAPAAWTFHDVVHSSVKQSCCALRAKKSQISSVCFMHFNQILFTATSLIHNYMLVWKTSLEPASVWAYTDLSSRSRSISLEKQFSCTLINQSLYWMKNNTGNAIRHAASKRHICPHLVASRSMILIEWKKNRIVHIIMP